MKQFKSILFMVALLLASTNTTIAQDDASYAMWETIMLTPDNSKLKVLGENMRKHNQTFHAEGPHRATVWQISSGPNSGKMVWQMGPLNYSHLDTRPGEGGHDEDWRDNVMPYIKKLGSIEYWKAHKEFQNVAMLDPNTVTHPILHVRFFEVKMGMGYSINTFFSRMHKTVLALEGENPWGIYVNEFRQGNLGRHFADVSFYKNFAEFDRDFKWIETFNATNGPNSWQNQMNMGRETFENSWDEIWVYSKELSGH